MGGSDVEIHEHPWAVAIYINDRMFDLFFSSFMKGVNQIIRFKNHD